MTDAARRAVDTLMEHARAIHETLESWAEIEPIVRKHVVTAIAQARAEERERIQAWPHVCAMEACCIENGLHALRRAATGGHDERPAPERGPSYTVHDAIAAGEGDDED
jgi:hypothetical protein